MVLSPIPEVLRLAQATTRAQSCRDMMSLRAVTTAASGLQCPWLWRSQPLCHSTRWMSGTTWMMSCGAKPTRMGADQARSRVRSQEWSLWKGLGARGHGHSGAGSTSCWQLPTAWCPKRVPPQSATPPCLYQRMLSAAQDGFEAAGTCLGLSCPLFRTVGHELLPGSWCCLQTPLVGSNI